MQRIIVSGIDTGVGKTLVSTILTLALDGEYWKPIECGNGDTKIVEKWIDSIHPPAYSLKAPLSPHHAARLENQKIKTKAISVPQTSKPLIIEGVGGILVPLTTKIHTLDLFQSWNGQWVVVSKHYLGSINHTLLTIDTLKQRQIPILGIFFNGEPNPDSEKAILEMTQLPCLGRLLPEPKLTLKTLRSYARQWRHHF